MYHLSVINKILKTEIYISAIRYIFFSSLFLIKLYMSDEDAGGFSKEEDPWDIVYKDAKMHD